MIAAESGGHGRRRQARRVDHHVGVEGEVVAMHAHARFDPFEVRHLRQEGDHAPGGLDVADQAQHEGVAVDDAGGLGVHPGQRIDLRFEGKNLGAAQPRQVADAVDAGLALVVLENGELFFRRRDDHLADALVRHIVGAAVLVEQLLAAHAHGGLHRAGRVVDAGVDDLGVAARRFRADHVVAFEDQHLPSGQRQRAGDGEADHARADHHGVASFHHPVDLSALALANDEAVQLAVARRTGEVVSHEAAEVGEVPAPSTGPWPPRKPSRRRPCRAPCCARSSAVPGRPARWRRWCDPRRRPCG